MEVVHSSLGHPGKHTTCTQLHMEVVHSSLGHPGKHTTCTQFHMEVVHSSLGHWDLCLLGDLIGFFSQYARGLPELRQDQGLFITDQVEKIFF